MESLKCPWCNSEGQQCSGSLKLQGAYSTDGVYYDGPNKNDITEYYICDTCGRGFNRCFSWSQWVKTNSSKKDSANSMANKRIEYLTKEINRVHETQLTFKEDRILCNVTDWAKIRELPVFDPVTRISQMEQGLLGHVYMIPVYADDSWDLTARKIKFDTPEGATKTLVDLLKSFEKKNEE